MFKPSETSSLIPYVSIAVLLNLTLCTGSTLADTGSTFSQGGSSSISHTTQNREINPGCHLALASGAEGHNGERTTGDSENVTLYGRFGKGPCFAVDLVDGIAYFGNGAYLEIINCSNPEIPMELGRLLLPGPVEGVVVGEDGYAYIADGDDGLRIIDVSDPTIPIEVGFLDTNKWAYSVDIVGEFAYVADHWDGLRIINVSDPSAPFEVGYYNTSGQATDVTIVDQIAYVADGTAGLCLINISNPAAPFRTSTLNTEGESRAVWVTGSYAYIADGTGGLRVINVVDESTPFEAGFFNPAGYDYYEDIFLADTLAFVADRNDGLRIINVSEIENPIEVGFFETTDCLSHCVSIHGTHAYFGNGENGLRIIDVSDPYLPSETSFFRTSGSASDISISGAHAFLAVRHAGLRILDISNPASPLEIGFIDTQGDSYGVAVNGSFAYVADGFGGLRVIDVSNPSNPFEVGFALESGFWHGKIAINGSYAYVTSGGSQYFLRILNVSNPAAPYEVSLFGTDSGTYGVAIDDSYAYLAVSTGLRIINVSNPTFPQEEGFIEIGGIWAVDVAVKDIYAYLVDANGNGGLHIIDISDPANPEVVGSFDTPGNSSGVAVNGDFAYVADGDDGLQIIDVSDPSSPVDAGYYETGGEAFDVAISGDHSFVADGDDGVWVLGSDLVPAILSNFDLNLVDSTITITWNAHTGSATEEFRLLGSRNGEQWTVPYQQYGPNQFVAEDRLASLDLCGEFKYTLHFRDSGVNWHFLHEESIIVNLTSHGGVAMSAFPNPFSPRTTISFALNTIQPVRISIYDIMGKKTAELLNEVRSRGRHEILWDGTNDHGTKLSSGIYIVRMEAKGFSESKRMILIK